MDDGALRNRQFYGDNSGSIAIAAATTGPKQLLAVRSSLHTIYVQGYRVRVTGGSTGKTWQLQDDSGTPVNVTGPLDCSAPFGDGDEFGPDGLALTQGQNLQLAISAAGAVGHVSFTAFQKLTGVGAPLTSGG